MPSISFIIFLFIYLFYFYFFKGGEHYICLECLKKVTEEQLVKNKTHHIKCVYGYTRERYSKIIWGSRGKGGSGKETEGIHLKRCNNKYDISSIKKVCDKGLSKKLIETLEQKEKIEKEQKREEEEKKIEEELKKKKEELKKKE
jgi:hypothetical protein